MWRLRSSLSKRVHRCTVISRRYRDKLTASYNNNNNIITEAKHCHSDVVCTFLRERVLYLPHALLTQLYVHILVQSWYATLWGHFDRRFYSRRRVFKRFCGLRVCVLFSSQLLNGVKTPNKTFFFFFVHLRSPPTFGYDFFSSHVIYAFDPVKPFRNG